MRARKERAVAHRSLQQFAVLAVEKGTKLSPHMRLLLEAATDRTQPRRRWVFW